MRRSHLAGITLLLTTTLTAQDPDTLLRDLPSDTSTLLIIRDPLPHIEALLRSPQLRTALDASRDLLQELTGTSLDAARIEQQLGLIQRFIPTELVCAFPASTIDTLCNLGRATTCLFLSQLAASQSADAETTEDLRRRVIEAVTGIGAVTGVVSIRTRDERTAESWFDTVADAADRFAATPGFTAKVVGTRLEVSFQPLALLDGARLLRASDIDPQPLADWTLSATIEQQGTRLVAHLGQPTAGPLTAKALARLYRADPSQLVYAQIDLGDGADALLDAYDALQLIDQEKLGPVAREPYLRLGGALDRLTDLARQTWLAIDLDSGLTMTAEYDFGTDLSSLDAPPEELARCIDAADGPFYLSGLSLDLMLWATLAEARTRALMRSNVLRQAPFLERLQPIIDYLDSDDSSLFDRGVAVVTGPGQLRALRLAAGEARATIAESLPLGALAIVAVAEPGPARTFVDRMTALLAEAANQTAKTAWEDVDLDLGVPTRALRWQEMWQEATGARLDLDADFRPHQAQRGHFMILSTDVALTRKLLAELDAPARPRPAQARLLGWWSCRGEHAAAVFNGMVQWQAKLRRQPGADDARIASFLQALGTACRLLDRFEGREDVNGTVYRGVTTVRVR